MPMLPQIPLPVRCGEPLDVTVPVLDANNQPVSSSSLSSARAQVRARVGSATVLHEWSTTAGNAQIVSGGVRLTATATETLTWQTDWPTPVPRWDLVVVDTAGNPSRLIDPSIVQLDPVLTRAALLIGGLYSSTYQPSH